MLKTQVFPESLRTGKKEEIRKFSPTNTNSWLLAFPIDILLYT